MNNKTRLAAVERRLARRQGADMPFIIDQARAPIVGLLTAVASGKFTAPAVVDHFPKVEALRADTLGWLATLTTNHSGENDLTGRSSS